MKFKIRYYHKQVHTNFDIFYNVAYEGLKTHMSGPYHYQSLNLLRRLIFAYVVFYFSSEEYTLFQILLNLILSLLFVLYLASARPFLDPDLNKMQLLNEVTYYLVSTLYLCFTDFNPHPAIKVNCGWVVVLLVILNLIWPNFTYMFTGIWPDIVKAISSKRKTVITRRLKRGLVQ